MRIEILFPEFCNLFGDMSNMRYLKKCLPDAEFVETPFDGEPVFLREPVNLVYLGPMTERTQEKVIQKFLPHREKIRELIETGTVFFFTGNALEILGSTIETEDGRRIDCLNLFPFHAKRDMMHRHNSTFLGSFQEKSVMGFKSQFTLAYPDGDLPGLFPVKRGVGLNKKCKFEGIHKNNCFGTYLLGPLLLLNPDFTRYLLSCMGAEKESLAFPEDMEEAYEVRLKDFLEKT